MAERPEDQQNWQLRQYDSFGPHFRIDTGNPQMGLNGTVVYDLIGSGKDNNTSIVGMSDCGIYHMYNDQCIEIMGGNNVDGGGVCVNIAGTKGDVWITAMSNGDVKITGTNILIDASKNVEIQAGSNFSVRANKINMSSNSCFIKAPRGKISVRDVSWSGAVFAGTSVPSGLYS